MASRRVVPPPDARPGTARRRGHRGGPSARTSAPEEVELPKTALGACRGRGRGASARRCCSGRSLSGGRPRRRGVGAGTIASRARGQPLRPTQRQADVCVAPDDRGAEPQADATAKPITPGRRRSPRRAAARRCAITETRSSPVAARSAARILSRSTSVRRRTAMPRRAPGDSTPRGRARLCHEAHALVDRRPCSVAYSSTVSAPCSRSHSIGLGQRAAQAAPPGAGSTPSAPIQPVAPKVATRRARRAPRGPRPRTPPPPDLRTGIQHGRRSAEPAAAVTATIGASAQAQVERSRAPPRRCQGAAPVGSARSRSASDRQPPARPAGPSGHTAVTPSGQA